MQLQHTQQQQHYITRRSSSSNNLIGKVIITGMNYEPIK